MLYNKDIMSLSIFYIIVLKTHQNKIILDESFGIEQKDMTFDHDFWY